MTTDLAQGRGSLLGRLALDRNLSRIADVASRITAIIKERKPDARLALDVGAQHGELTALLARETGIEFVGIEPDPYERSLAIGPLRILPGAANCIPYPAASFDVVTLVSVLEHIRPIDRPDSFSEMRRVLKPGGLLVGQFPNMSFPIELHSMLPLQTLLPRGLGDWLVRKCSPTPWRSAGCTWYRLRPGDVRRECLQAGYSNGSVWPANYARGSVPLPFRLVYGISRAIPMGYDFCFVA